MIFGKKELFAIEAELSQGGEYIFINYCFWVKNEMIGDNTQTALLPSVMDMVSIVLNKKGMRKIDNIDFISPINLTKYLIQFLWNKKDESLHDGFINNFVESNISDIDICSYHDECFQGFFVFLIEGVGYDWILCKIEDSNYYTNQKVPSNYIYNCFNNFSEWIKQSTILVLRSFFEKNINNISG